MTPEKPKKPLAKEDEPLLPPDERFWKRYSPHHEFPWSTVLGVTAHLLAFGLVLGYLWVQKKQTEGAEPLKVGAVVIAGGGGDPNGEGNGPGKPSRAEDTGENPNTKLEFKPPPGPISKEMLKSARVDPLESLEFKGEDGRLLDDAPEATKRLASVGEDLRKSLFAGIQGPKQGKGEGGTGSGGGKGKGKGTGEGDLEGPGKGNISVRQRRVLRWTMIFNTTDGFDYAKQLTALKAIIAVPAANDEYTVIRDLSRRPVTGKVEDLTELNRIFWVDDQPSSVGPLAFALGLRPPPARLVAFFPPELEEKLLDLEKRYSGGKEEDQIKETRFRVRRVGRGYEPYVESQR
jgi:hypothetical protein